jgi:CMD domain protein
MSQLPSDVIDHLAGIARGSHLDAVRGERAEARANAQASHRALFEPSEPGAFESRKRLAIAAFVAGLHGDAAVSAFYADALQRAGGSSELAAAISREIARGATQGPYGDYPAGPLSAENEAGQNYTVAEEHRTFLGNALTAAFEHAHFLIFHPRDASQKTLGVLHEAGLSTTDIVTLSQLVAFLAFQIRAAIGLRVLAAA